MEPRQPGQGGSEMIIENHSTGPATCSHEQSVPVGAGDCSQALKAILRANGYAGGRKQGNRQMEVQT
ncbi:unnamed protein product [Protopolystoma xenopodis]|uniref:Uncharacterized protein n=1 Tax=Protopolystoma xenopodis TaxID=117903 RepID=A0A448XP91_9PLAT|nr:unnamed protein product [Protopolystoma xenopodis]